jgi:DNA-binding MarR family transcriptional regulator
MPELPATPRSDPRVAWHNLLQVSSRVLREFERRLDRRHRIALKEFDVLITLDNHAPLRMTDLANAVLLSSGGLTRLVGRLEERGLVRRDPDTADGRSFQASLTAEGRAALAEARVTHDAVIEELLGAPLADDELDALAAILGRALAPQAGAAS